jgi:hypothetical protein
VAVLHGSIVREIDGRILFSVEADQADAPRFGLSGEIWLARRQCRKVIESKQPWGADIVELDDAVAESKAPRNIPATHQGTGHGRTQQGRD